MNCPACGFKISKDYKFCPSCGSEIPVQKEEMSTSSSDMIILCDVCGEENSVDSKYCSSCGAKLAGEVSIKTGSTEKKVPVKNKINKESKEVQRLPERKGGSQSGKKTVKPKEEIAVKNNRNLSPLNIVLLVAGLLLLGYVILDLSGVFDSPEQPAQVTNAGNENSTSQINLADLKRIEELEKTVQLDSSKTDSVLELAHKLGDAGFLDKAVKYYEMYLRQNPRNADVNVDLGVVFFELKQYDKAKARMLKGINLNPSHQIAHFNIGVVNSSEGKLDSAKIWWKKAVEINPATEIGRRAQELLNQH